MIKNLKIGSATRYDGVSNIALRSTADAITPYLTRLFNMCMTCGKMPSSWKRANVTPIYKKGSPSTTANYRPISLLSCASKVLEHLVADRLKAYLESNNLFTQQHGFRKGSSTIDQLLDVYQEITEGPDRRLVTKLLFLDVSKAFDRVWHKALIHKLQCLDISGRLLAFFRDYLMNRFQRVVLKGVLSDWLQIMAGVPQGSILGPLLYLIFSNDIVGRIGCLIKLFADDTILGATDASPNECCRRLQPDIVTILDWANRWKVTLCPVKTKCLTISRINHRFCPLWMSGLMVEEISSHCHLGVRLQSDGKWGNQVDHMIQKAETRLRILKAYSRRLNRQALLQLYRSYIRPDTRVR